MPRPRENLSLPYVTVVYDGTCYEVQTTAADAIQFDRTRAQHKWPTSSDAPYMWMAFLAWHALRREQQLTVTWDDFQATVEDVTVDDEPDDVDPTRSVPTLE